MGKRVLRRHHLHGSSHPSITFVHYKGGYFRSGEQSGRNSVAFSCQDFGYKYYTDQAAAMWIYKWNGSAYALCKRHPASDYAYKFDWRYEYNKAYSSTPPCGSGKYKMEGVGWSDVNGTYVGGRVLYFNSGTTYHQLPSS